MRSSFASIPVVVSRWRGEFTQGWPGVLMSVVIAVAATFIADHRGGPTLLYALLLGMALNSVATEGRAKPGVDIAARRILRVGVALLGARITFEQIGGLGWLNGGLMVVGVVLTIVVGVGAAKALGLSRRLGVLTGGATAICGASAAIAIATILPRDERSERELVFTIAGVTVLSTLAMIVYPVLANMMGLDAQRTGVFLGGTIHDVAQVVGAGYSISPEVGDYAVLTKLLRVAMLLPVVTVISLAVRHRLQRKGETSTGDPLLPPFLLAFVGLVILGSLGLIPQSIGDALNDVARGCLVIAIAAVGLKTSPLEMKRVGARAFALLGFEAVFLAATVLAVQRLIG